MSKKYIRWYSKEKNITMEDYFSKMLNNNLTLKKESDISSLGPIKGYVVLDTYGEDLKPEYKKDVLTRLEHMGGCTNYNKDLWRVYNKELIPIFRNIEEAYGFAEFLWGNVGRTLTIHEVEIKINPVVLDINGGRSED
jgi:hypothetical protein